MAVIVLSIIMLIASAFTWMHFKLQLIPIAVRVILQHFVYARTSTVYHALLYSLYKRIFSLNSFLRLVEVTKISDRKELILSYSL